MIEFVVSPLQLTNFGGGGERLLQCWAGISFEYLENNYSSCTGRSSENVYM